MRVIEVSNGVRILEGKTARGYGKSLDHVACFLTNYRRVLSKYMCDPENEGSSVNAAIIRILFGWPPTRIGDSSYSITHMLASTFDNGDYKT